MSDPREQTIETYNKSAAALAEYFKGIGPRIKDIDIAFGLLDPKPQDPNVVEIGCGDGRDAAEIVKRTNNYVGFDPSIGMIELARKHLPDARFVFGEAETFDYPKGMDIAFAFASLLHSDKDQVGLIIKRVGASMNNGGIFFISLKYSEEYVSGIKKDQYGERLFYFYSPENIKELSAKLFKPVYENRKTIGNTEWFEIALQKN